MQSNQFPPQLIPLIKLPRLNQFLLNLGYLITPRFHRQPPPEHFYLILNLSLLLLQRSILTQHRLILSHSIASIDQEALVAFAALLTLLA